jgi:hypothetical protein
MTPLNSLATLLSAEVDALQLSNRSPFPLQTDRLVAFCSRVDSYNVRWRERGEVVSEQKGNASGESGPSVKL